MGPIRNCYWVRSIWSVKDARIYGILIPMQQSKVTTNIAFP
jgi:hypothetical protein